MLNPIITSEVTLQDYPLFTVPTKLNGPNASAYANSARFYLLGHVFPATTYAAGRNPLEVQTIRDWNMNDINSSLKHGWWQNKPPEDWKWTHNDCKNIALLYTQELFKKIAKEGDLK